MIYSKIDLQKKSLPEDPGIYKFFDKLNNIIYVGKAKNLKKRVLSYFNKNHVHHRTKLLVKQISKIENIVVETEMDALLLENSLIKKFKPKYNVLLKDDKTYPWICIIKSPRPEIFYTRKTKIKNGEYFGPFTNVIYVRYLIKLIKDIYPFLNYDLIHLLKKETKELTIKEIDENIKSIKSIIKGNFKSTVKNLKSKMKKYSLSMEYEKAQEAKEKLNILKNYQVKSTIVNPKLSNIDVFSIYSDETFGYVNFMQISYGSIISSYTIEIKKKINESDEEILRLAIIELRQRFKSKNNLILLSLKINLDMMIKCNVPKKGDKKKLVDLSIKNAKSYRLEKFKQIKLTDPNRHTKRMLSQVKSDLNLINDPFHIECFDNSNLQGSNPVGSCIVFKNLKPNKKEYRLYNIKSVEGPNDFASMEEIIYRRYKRLLKEKKTLPNLIIIDGGKGQLSSAFKSLCLLKLDKKIEIISIAKKLEEIYSIKDSNPLYLDKRSETLKIIQHARNESHRFALNFHRKKREKYSLNSELDSIKGLGPKTNLKLLNTYKSFKRIQNTSLSDLQSLLGEKKGKKIFKALKKTI
ncbi:MAG: excinuclease ABC subunit C [Flavobacteriaceae bacterium]|nr:excinuclease ABC subunit C [Flavobacteriaceae bacterium]